jgi:hypothetical protein
MNITEQYELSLGRLTLPPADPHLLGNEPVAPESGNWKSAIKQATAEASVRRDPCISRRAPLALAENCFANPTRIPIGGAR